MSELLEKSFIDLREANSKYSIEVLKQNETIVKLKEENEKLKEILQDVGSKTHKSKLLHEWYSENVELKTSNEELG